MRGEQRERPHQPACIAFGEHEHLLAQDRIETDGGDRLADSHAGLPVYGSEELQHARDILLLPGANPFGQIEDRSAPMRRSGRRPAPEDGAAIHRDERGHGFEQRRLAGAVRSDQAEHLGAMHRKAHVVEHPLLAIALGQAHRLKQRRSLKDASRRGNGKQRRGASVHAQSPRQASVAQSLDGWRLTGSLRFPVRSRYRSGLPRARFVRRSFTSSCLTHVPAPASRLGFTGLGARTGPGTKDAEKDAENRLHGRTCIWGATFFLGTNRGTLVWVGEA